jgi:hypothetical protein
MALQSVRKKGRNQDLARSPMPPLNNTEKKNKKQETAKALAAELNVLRSALKEMAEHFRLRVDSRLVEMIRILSREQVLDEPQVLPQAKCSRQWAEKVRALKLKPQKGKLKEMHRISKLVDKLAKAMPNQP